MPAPLWAGSVDWCEEAYTTPPPMPTAATPTAATTAIRCAFDSGRRGPLGGAAGASAPAGTSGSASPGGSASAPAAGAD
jgi:hypothetical protein